MPMPMPTPMIFSIKNEDISFGANDTEALSMDKWEDVTYLMTIPGFKCVKIQLKLKPISPICLKISPMVENLTIETI